MNIEELKRKIVEANNLYRSGCSPLTDGEYDSLCEDLRKGIPLTAWIEFYNSLHENKGKIQHPFVMGSLDKIKAEEPETLTKFINEHISSTISVSRKVDGISCRLHYENGKLISASSRGDGYFGEDFTNKIKFVKGVRETISSTLPLDIRGELVILKQDFDNISNEFSNPRNACAGIMNRKDWTPEQVSNISFIAYTILGYEYIKEGQFSKLASLGFDVVDHYTFAKDEYEKSDFCNKLIGLAQDSSCNYETDGLVISDSNYRNENLYRPDGQIAFKINQLVGETTLLDINWEGPSKNGRYCPVAILDPIELGGAMIGRATLHNVNIIETLGIYYGCRVKIVKSGDIIPKVVEVIRDGSDEHEKIKYPETCSSCGRELSFDGVNFYCSHEDDCPDQIVEVVNQFIRRLKVKNVSVASLKNFGIYSFKDLIEFRPKSKYKSEVKFYDELTEKVFNTSKFNLLCATNFKDIAEVTIKKIADYYGMDSWLFNDERQMNLNLLITEQGLPTDVGEITMEKFIENLEKNMAIVKMFTSDGRYKYVDAVTVTSSKKEYLGSVCFTGSLNRMTRTEASKVAEDAGYEVKSGVSKGLTYLVTNDSNTNSSKGKKARALGTKIINEDEFFEMIKKTNNDVNLEDL